MAEYRIAETQTFQNKMESASFRRHYPRIVETIYPRLRSNPYYGPNIKRLRGELSAVFRYRVGDCRLFYSMDAQRDTVFVLDPVHRKHAYR